MSTARQRRHEIRALANRRARVDEKLRLNKPLTRVEREELDRMQAELHADIDTRLREMSAVTSRRRVR